MAANVTVMEHGERGGFFGRSFVRLTIAALLAVLVLGAMSEMASARPATTTMGQNDFTSKCRAGGGTPKRLAPHLVQCTTRSGEVVVCDFNTSPANCVISFAPQQGGPWGPITGGVLEPVDAEPSGPVVPRGEVIDVGGGVIQPAETSSGSSVTTAGSIQVVDAVVENEPAPSPAPSPAPESQVAPLPGGVAAAEPVVVEVVEDEQQ